MWQWLGLESTVPHTYTTLGMSPHGLSLKLLKAFFRGMEPQSLGRHSLRALVPENRREVQYSDMLELLEFMTDLDPATPITGDLRRTDELFNELQSRNLANNRRARELLLPPNWQEKGFYQIRDHNGDKLVLYDKIEELDTVVKPVNLGMASGMAFARVRIDRNFSILRAELVSPCGMKRKSCQAAFRTSRVAAKAASAGERRPAARPSAPPVVETDAHVMPPPPPPAAEGGAAEGEDSEEAA